MKEDTVEASSGQRYLDSANNNRSTMNKGLQIVFLCLAAASAVYARPGVFGYPYGAVPHVGALPVPVHDTPEVAAAKAAHFAAYNAAASGTAVGVYAGPYVGHEDDGQYRPGYEGQYLEHDDGLYRGHYVDGLYRGHYDDGQYHGEGLYASQYGHYAGPIAGVPVIVNGVPADTPEVAAAKAAHFAAHAHSGHYYG